MIVAFGLPGTDTTTDGSQFLGRIQFDARVGFWKTVKRVQGPDGMWADDTSEPFKDPTFLMDMGSLEVGFIKLASPPAFVLVPYGQLLPPQPQEMTADQNGKQRRAFSAGCRVKVFSPKTFGDNAAYHFTVNSKTVLQPMDELYQDFSKHPEAAGGKIPAVSCAGCRIVEVTTPQGKSKFYAPIFQIASWHDRNAEIFGERSVPPPSSNGAQRSAPPASNHVPPPAAKAAAKPVTPDMSDAIPF